MPAEPDPVSENIPAAALIAVPEDAIDELVEAGLVRELPTLQGPVFDSAVTIGTDSATFVTLLRTPGTIRAFAAWLADRVRRRDGITITANRGERMLRLQVDGSIPVETVTDFLLAAFQDTTTQTAPEHTLTTREPRTASPEIADILTTADSIHTVIYADVDEGSEAWRQLSAASTALAESLGYVLERQLPAEYGSIFQRAFWKRVVTSDEARRYEATLQQALGLKVATLNQAEVDSKQAAAAAALIGALAPISTACVKVGSVLVLKYASVPGDDPVVLARTLSAQEVQAIDRYPAILKNPVTALDALTLALTADDKLEANIDEARPE